MHGTATGLRALVGAVCLTAAGGLLGPAAGTEEGRVLSGEQLASLLPGTTVIGTRQHPTHNIVVWEFGPGGALTAEASSWNVDLPSYEASGRWSVLDDRLCLTVSESSLTAHRQGAAVTFSMPGYEGCYEVVARGTDFTLFDRDDDFFAWFTAVPADTVFSQGQLGVLEAEMARYQDRRETASYEQAWRRLRDAQAERERFLVELQRTAQSMIAAGEREAYTRRQLARAAESEQAEQADKAAQAPQTAEDRPTAEQLAAAPPKVAPEPAGSSAEPMPPQPLIGRDCLSAEGSRMVECREWLAAYEAWKRRQSATQDVAAEARESVDSQPPVIRIRAPRTVDVAAGSFLISGLVGDDGSPPRLTMDGERQRVYAPGAHEPAIARHTLGFAIPVPIETAGQQGFVFEACDASGNCLSKQLVVSVVDAKAASRRETAASAEGEPGELEALLEEARRQRELAEAERRAAEIERRAVKEEARRLAEARLLAEEQARRQAAPEVVEAPTDTPDETSGTQLAVIQRKLEELSRQRAVQDITLPLIRAEVPERVEVGDRVRITGLVGDNASPPRLRVNGEPAPLFRLRSDAAPIAEHTMAFRLDVDASAVGEQRYLLEACDASGNCVAQEVAVRVVAANRPNMAARNHALIIGNDAYGNLPDLKTAVADASALAEILVARYAFERSDVRLLLNADRRTMLDAIGELRRRLSEEDRLLIYYAGHGQIDPATKEGFWQPVDAEPGKDYTWIDNASIRRYLRGIPAKHVLVMSDSCFSGTLTRGASLYVNVPKDRFFTEIDSHLSRKVISSGGTEPVADEGSGGHSVFAYYLLKTLRDNDRPYITSFELFNKFVRAVTNNSDQKPEHGTVSDAGDEGSGDFTFILKKGS